MFVTARENESQESLIRRFSSMVAREGIVQESRQRMFFVSRTRKRREERLRAARRYQYKQARERAKIWRQLTT
jgi:ribosomal protein S21